jgi:hypothetical protein
MPLTEIQASDRIRELNDAFRKTLEPKLGRAVMTAGIGSLPASEQMAAIEKVKSFDAFDADNDPHGEHDFGSFEVAGNRLFWKIDYYDRALEYGSDDPADPLKTTRVLTLMLAEEY